MKGLCVQAIISFFLCVFFIEATFAQDTVIIDTKGWAGNLGVGGENRVDIVVKMKDGTPDISGVIRHLERLLGQSIWQVRYNTSLILSDVKEELSRLCHGSDSCERGLNDSIIDARQEVFARRQSQRILFPDDFQRNCRDDEALQQIKELSRCSHFCNIQKNSCLIRKLSHGSSLESVIMDKVKSLKPFCRKKIIYHLKDRLYNWGEVLPKDCKNSEGSQYKSSDIKRCSDIEERLELVIKERILPLMTDDFLSSDLNECRVYESGEERSVMSGSRRDNYLVKKNPDGSYTIPLAMKFEAADDYNYDHKVPKAEVPNYYFRKVKNCINKSANPSLIGRGERLNIEILNYDNSRCIPKHSISIQSSEGRSNSESYEADINCSTIIYEVLHLLGLNDEYRERTLKEDPLDDNSPADYQCRVVQEDSIMATHNS